MWRGYASRKKVFDFYGRKKYFRDLEWKTELMRCVIVLVSCYCHVFCSLLHPLFQIQGIVVQYPRLQHPSQCRMRSDMTLIKEDVLNWLQTAATTAFVKWMKLHSSHCNQVSPAKPISVYIYSNSGVTWDCSYILWWVIWLIYKFDDRLIKSGFLLKVLVSWYVDREWLSSGDGWTIHICYSGAFLQPSE